MENEPINIPDNFQTIINDFLSDLSTTFPEFNYLWLGMTKDTIELYRYCISIYPERFFDILYQNDEIFLLDSKINTSFLPNVDFKLLFAVPDISENTKKSIWKYLQLILITITSGIKEKTNFGETADIFQGINEEELQEKLSETIKGLSDFFSNIEKESEENDKESNDDKEELNDGIFSEMPNVDDLHNHLKGIFDGKIGSLAKELAEELSEDLMGEFGPGSNTSDIFKNIMKDPSKLMNIMKKVSGKLDEKMKNGDISQEDIMKELSGLMSGMKGSKGDIQEIMKNLMKKMGPMMKGDGLEEMIKSMMSSLGKGAKMDTNKLNTMNSMQKHKERMKAKLEQRRQAAILTAQKQQQEKMNTTIENTLVTNDDWLEETPKTIPTSNPSKKKKGKSKK